MGLFTPAWQSRNEKRARAFTEKAQDYLTLKEIAGSAPLPKVRSCALRKIDNPRALLPFLETETDDSVRRELWERLHNSSRLLSLIKDRTAEDAVKKQALSLIDDENMLLQLIRESKDKTVRQLASGRIVSRQALLTAAKTEISAAARLSEAEDIIGVLTETENPEIADSLLSKAEDPAAYPILALKARQPKIRRFATERLSDPEEIRSVLLHTRKNDVAEILLPKVSDEAFYLTLAKEADYERVRVQAASYLSDETAIAKLILDDPRRFSSLLNKIRSPEVLQQIEDAATDPNLLGSLFRLQGVYRCRVCGKKSPVSSCLCRFCGAENHDYRHKSDIREYRDYATGTRWDECARCGKRINMKSVYDEYLE